MKHPRIELLPELLEAESSPIAPRTALTVVAQDQPHIQLLREEPPELQDFVARLREGLKRLDRLA